MNLVAFVVRILRWLLLGFLFLFFIRLLRRVLNPIPPRQRRREPPAEQLVQDPECGAFLPPSIAVRARGPHGQVVYFCSEACARAFIRKRTLQEGPRSASL